VRDDDDGGPGDLKPLEALDDFNRALRIQMGRARGSAIRAR
jgi:hypothetical protein